MRRFQLVLAFAIVAAAAPRAMAQACYGAINNDNYVGNIQNADLSALTQMTLAGGKLQLTTGKTSGSAISTTLTAAPYTPAIPAGDLANSTLTRLHIQASVSFPNPCPQPPAGSPLGAGQTTRFDIAYSVDGGTSFQTVIFPTTNDLYNGDATIDLINAGVSGNALRWRAIVGTSVAGCYPILNSIKVGWQALRTGKYQASAPIPVANALFRSQYEPQASTWTITGADRSPRGNLIAFTARDEKNHMDIFTLDVKKGELKRVTQGQGDNEDPSFSPNGRLLVFTTTRNGPRQVVVSNLDGTHQSVITAGGEYSAPSWGPFPK